MNPTSPPPPHPHPQLIVNMLFLSISIWLVEASSLLMGSVEAGWARGRLLLRIWVLLSQEGREWLIFQTALASPPSVWPEQGCRAQTQSVICQFRCNVSPEVGNLGMTTNQLRSLSLMPWFNSQMDGLDAMADADLPVPELPCHLNQATGSDQCGLSIIQYCLAVTLRRSVSQLGFLRSFTRIQHQIKPGTYSMHHICSTTEQSLHSYIIELHAIQSKACLSTNTCSWVYYT